MRTTPITIQSSVPIVEGMTMKQMMSALSYMYVPISLGLFMDHTFGISAMNRPHPYLVSLSAVTLLAFSLKSLASEN